MTVHKIDVYQVSVPFRSVVSWASGVRSGTTRLIVKVTAHDGMVGYGETFYLPFVDAALRQQVIPVVLGEDESDLERIHRKILGAGFYHHRRAVNYASAGVEMALYDLLGRRAGMPLYKLLGGKYRDRIESIAFIPTQDPEQLVTQARAAVADGFRTIKIKVGTNPHLDSELVRRLREAVGPEVQIRADLNQALTVGSAKRLLRRLEPYDLQYLEQPLLLTELEASHDLRQVTTVPIALDESAYTPEDALEIVRRRAADVILVDPHQAGGLLPCKKAAAVAEAAAIPVGLHSGGELGLSMAAMLHLAASTPNMLYAIDNQYLHNSDDIVTAPLAVEEGAFRVPEGPGLGVEVDEEKLERYGTTEYYSPYGRADDPSWFAPKPTY
ncbi:MAG TPA: mandelate racemase/muconate lactonizing enzyme family protein [Trueperaceae bacterium]|nr:mandelate racemase/muconate lactonizing enzyme family protein [Trueperaceae bacterium]